jgi:hypothetical protein
VDGQVVATLVPSDAPPGPRDKPGAGYRFPFLPANTEWTLDTAIPNWRLVPASSSRAPVQPGLYAAAAVAPLRALEESPI